jgi:triosephosphate isomerase (TIM)
MKTNSTKHFSQGKQSSRTLYLYGNWKMNPDTLGQAAELTKKTVLLTKKNAHVTTALAVPAVFCEHVVKASKGSIDIGVQNIHFDMRGAHTGDISVSQVQSVGARFTIVGHSERRSLGETNEDINKKILSAVSQKLNVVLCVGETVRDDHGDYLKEIKHQVASALMGIDKKYLKLITIAYEPIWAIGANATGVATPAESLEVSILIRRVLSDIYSDSISKNMVLLYGGSASSDNAKSFFDEGGVQGFLLGRASLDVLELEKIIRSVL